VEPTTVRLLVLDNSGILPWLVAHAAPAGVEVEAVSSLDEAERRVREQPPDGAVVSMPHSQLPWAGFQHLCATRRPPVPVLYTSCEHHDAGEAGIDPGEGVSLFLPKPVAHGRLHQALAELLHVDGGAAGVERGELGISTQPVGTATQRRGSDPD
jgi:DNA-binding NtrC family response regulator